MSGSTRDECASSGESGLRLVHLTTAHDPGDSRIFRKECRSLQQSLGGVRFIAPGDDSYVSEGVTVHSVPRSQSRLGRFVLTLPRVYFAARRSGGQIFHLHDPDLLLVAPLLGRRAKVVFDSHEDYPRDLKSRPYLQNAVGRAIVSAYALFERRVFSKLDAVIAVNRAMQERIKKHQPLTVTVYNFPIASELPEPVEEKANENKVIWLGLINEARGVKTLAKAAEQLPPGTIQVIGTCDDLEAEDSRLSLLGRMSFSDAVDCASNYAAGLATFARTPFHQDMFPIKLFEYMLMGLPIVASDFRKWRDLIGPADCCVFVDPADANEIADAIRWILNNPSDARAMGRRGRSYALERFNWATEAEKLDRLYRNLLDLPDEKGRYISEEDLEMQRVE